MGSSINNQGHPFHLVDPSPWPFTGAFGALTSTCGGVMCMHGYVGGGFTLVLGFLLILLTILPVKNIKDFLINSFSMIGLEQPSKLLFPFFGEYPITTSVFLGIGGLALYFLFFKPSGPDDSSSISSDSLSIDKNSTISSESPSNNLLSNIKSDLPGTDSVKGEFEFTNDFLEYIFYEKTFLPWCKSNSFTELNFDGFVLYKYLCTKNGLPLINEHVLNDFVLYSNFIRKGDFLPSNFLFEDFCLLKMFCKDKSIELNTESLDLFIKDFGFESSSAKTSAEILLTPLDWIYYNNVFLPWSGNLSTEFPFDGFLLYKKICDEHDLTLLSSSSLDNFVFYSSFMNEFNLSPDNLLFGDFLPFKTFCDESNIELTIDSLNLFVQQEGVENFSWGLGNSSSESFDWCSVDLSENEFLYEAFSKLSDSF